MKIYQSKGGGGEGTSRISESSHRLEAEWTPHAAWRARKMTFKNPGDHWGKIPGNNMQIGWEDVGELKWKWSIPYWQDKSQTKGYLPIRITVLIQKPVVGCGHAFGGLQYKIMKSVILTIKWSPLTITRYLTAEDAPQKSLSQLCVYFSLL